MYTYIGLYIKLGATKLEWYFLISEKTFQFSDWDELLNLKCNKVKLKKWTLSSYSQGKEVFGDSTEESFHMSK